MTILRRMFLDLPLAIMQPIPAFVAARAEANFVAMPPVPRSQVLLPPSLRIFCETSRTRGYLDAESLAGISPREFDPTRLQCGSSRAVTSRGVFVCPLLVDQDDGRMGGSIAETLAPFELRHGACYTCYVTGMTCGNG